MKPTLDDLSDAVIAAFPTLSEAEQFGSLAVYRLLAERRPVTAQQISGASGVAHEAVREMLAKWHGVQRNEEGAVTAFWGLTLAETKHRFHVGGRTLHTWCAWDTLFLPPLLGTTASVESKCPVTGNRIALRIGPAGIESSEPEGAVLSFVTPRESEVQRSLIESFCCHVHFFASPEAGEEWTAQRSGTFLLSLDDAWKIGIRKNAAQYAVALMAGVAAAK